MGRSAHRARRLELRPVRCGQRGALWSRKHAAADITLQGTGLGTGSALTIRTSYGALQWAADAPVRTGGMSVTRPANDPGFDWIAYSRGRVSLETAGAPRLIVPVWAELVRVIEDCRG